MSVPGLAIVKGVIVLCKCAVCFIDVHISVGTPRKAGFSE